MKHKQIKFKVCKTLDENVEFIRNISARLLVKPTTLVGVWANGLDIGMRKVVEASLQIPNLSVFGCCEGHNKTKAYIVFVVTDEHLDLINTIQDSMYRYKHDTVFLPKIIGTQKYPYHDLDNRSRCYRVISHTIPANERFIFDMYETLIDLKLILEGEAIDE